MAEETVNMPTPPAGPPPRRDDNDDEVRRKEAEHDDDDASDENSRDGPSRKAEGANFWKAFSPLLLCRSLSTRT